MILLNYKDSRPIYEQIIEQIKQLVMKGVLIKDESLPSVRSLAMELSINPNTIQRAYQELERQGVIYSVKGKGSFVALQTELIINKKKEITTKMTELIQIGKEIGMTKEEFITLIERSLEGEKEND